MAVAAMSPQWHPNPAYVNVQLWRRIHELVTGLGAETKIGRGPATQLERVVQGELGNPGKKGKGKGTKKK